MLGPFALNWINPSETIQSIAEIGAVFLLFHAGLETSPGDLIRGGRKALSVAACRHRRSLHPGFAYMKWRGDASTEAIFVGAALKLSSLAVPNNKWARSGTYTNPVLLPAQSLTD